MPRPSGLATLLNRTASAVEGFGSRGAVPFSNAKRMQLVESCSADPQRIDTAAGVIRGVRVLGKVSQNNREYSEQAMKDAVRLYEGAAVFINHPDRSKPNVERSLRDKIGFLRNARIEGDAVRADLHYIKAHPEAGLITEMAQRNPRMFGLSHNAEGRMGMQGGKRVVESVESVRSVDLVSNPATNTGLFESFALQEEDAMAPMAIDDAAGKSLSNSWDAIRKGFAADAAEIVASSMTRKEKEKKFAELLDAWEVAEATLNKKKEKTDETPPGEMLSSPPLLGSKTLGAGPYLKMQESFVGSSAVGLGLDRFMTTDGRFARSANDDRDEARFAKIGRRDEPEQLTEEEQRAEAEQAEKDRIRAFAKSVMKQPWH